jgi:hypothetical protein
MDEYLSRSISKLSRCLVNAGQTGPLQQKIPSFSIKLWTVLDILGTCAYFVDLKEGFDLISIFLDLILGLGLFLVFSVKNVLYKYFKTWTSMTSYVNEENCLSVWCFVLDDVYEMIM